MRLFRYAPIILVAVCAFLIASVVRLPRSAFSAEELVGKAIAVHDGDTVSILTNSQRKLRMRLFGIDAPEQGQPFGTRARRELSQLVLEKTVRAKIHTNDQYGRAVAELSLLSGENVNHELVARGLAWWYRRYAPSDTRLEQLEREAREKGRGLWTDKDPTPPWKWRKSHSRR